MSRAWSLALPVLTVLVVTYALLVAGVPRKIIGARVYGGPTEGAAQLSLRIEAVSRDGERETPFSAGPLAVHAQVAAAPPLDISLPSSVGGVADVVLPFGAAVHGPVQLELRDAFGALLVGGAFSLDAAHWAARARRRGGWVRGRATGALVLSVAAERGTFVVGSMGGLLVRVERAGSPVVGARLTVSAEGARLGDAADLRTDQRGGARLLFEPSELNPTVRVEAHMDDGQSGLIDSGVSVVPGGFFVLPSPIGFRVESAVPRAQAFYSLVTERGRVAGGVVPLSATGRGGSQGAVELPAWPHPAWLVVSSDLDLHSDAAIGWPLDASSEPAQTFDVPDQLLLDGLPAAFAREQARRSRVRWLSAAFIALAFALSVVLLVVRVRAADRQLTQHLGEGLDPELVARVAPRRLLSLLVALLAIGLGFIALGLIVAARSR